MKTWLRKETFCNGNFYGATVNGGMYGNGVVFEMTPAGAFTDLHDFDPNTEGGEPFSALIEGTNGVLYDRLWGNLQRRNDLLHSFGRRKS
jgi:uncharacterized repeat protein (TIGR03803 family)